MRKKINRMMIIVFITCVVNLAFDGFLLYENHQAKIKYETIIYEYIPHEEDYFNLSKNMYEMQSLALAQIVTKDQEHSQKYLTEIEELNKSIHKTLTTYASFSQDTEEQALLQKLYSTYVDYCTQQKTLAELSKENSLENAYNYVNNVMETKLNEINSILDDINEIIHQNIDKSKETLARSNVSSHILIVFISLFSISLIALLVTAFRRLSTRLVSHIDLEMANREQQIIQMQSKTIEGMAELVESRDGETGAHVRNTAFFVELIAKKLAEDSPYKHILTPEYISLLKRYAPLHDVGKIVISDTILLKPARLTKDEFELMKQHTVEGGHIIDSILSDIETPEHVQIAHDIAVYHHEKWDGTGYPSHLSGQDIPLCARIMSVADVFDALISKRCYKDAFTLKDAYQIIREAEGTQFDPNIVKAFFSAQTRIEDYIKNSQNSLPV